MEPKNFLYPYYPYHGKFKLNTLAFNANLQEFSHRVGYISNLHTGGKLSSNEAYQALESLWHELQTTKRKLNIDPFTET